MKIMKKVDDGFFKVFQWVVDKWSRVTGKSNFKLAYLLIAIFSPMIIGGLWLEYMDTGNSLEAFLAVFLFFGSLALIFWTRRFERAVERSEDSGAVPWKIVWEIERRRGRRVIFMLFGMAVLAMAFLPSTNFYGRLVYIGVFLMEAHEYVVLCINPGGKSLYERAKEKVRSFVLKPAAQPVPMAI